MAVKLGKVPQRDGSKPGKELSGKIGETVARRRHMTLIYHEIAPDWQDCQIGRSEMFSELFEALDGDGFFSSEKKMMYLPAANKQLDTNVFSDRCGNILFIGGDIVRSAVSEGKAETKIRNTDFVAADGFYVPFENGSLDAVIDVAGAAWYALDTLSRQKAKRNFKSLLHEWHKTLGPKGAVVLDDFPRDGNGYIPTIRRFQEMCPDIFENVEKGGFYFQVGDYRVAFKARIVKLKTAGQAYILEKL